MNKVPQDIDITLDDILSTDWSTCNFKDKITKGILKLSVKLLDTTITIESSMKLDTHINRYELIYKIYLLDTNLNQNIARHGSVFIRLYAREYYLCTISDWISQFLNQLGGISSYEEVVKVADADIY
jgi:hypothetical protein